MQHVGSSCPGTFCIRGHFVSVANSTADAMSPPSHASRAPAPVSSQTSSDPAYAGRRVTTTVPSPIGPLTLLAIDGALAGLYMEEHRHGPRAVGLANGRNPVTIVVPCHRVVGSDGRLTGYGGGLDRKSQLLALERRAAGAG